MRDAGVPGSGIKTRTYRVSRWLAEVVGIQTCVHAAAAHGMSTHGALAAVGASASALVCGPVPWWSPLASAGASFCFPFLPGGGGGVLSVVTATFDGNGTGVSCGCGTFRVR